jgi:hypothetical protein
LASIPYTAADWVRNSMGVLQQTSVCAQQLFSYAKAQPQAVPCKQTERASYEARSPFL